MPSFSTSRSTTTSMSCLYFLSSTISSSSVADLAVDAHAREALALEVVEQLAVLALAALDDRREHLELGLLGQLEDAVDDLVGSLPLDLAAADRAVRDADARVEQAQVVVDLGDGAHRGARVLRRRLLVDRDRRRQALDVVDVGLVHLAEELPRVRREGLDVAALALGVDGVERERGLARAGQAGDHDELVARDVEVDVLEVVLAGAADGDAIQGHGVTFPERAECGSRQTPSIRAPPGRARASGVTPA